MPNGSNCPLYIVTGASGVGKSALCREMAKIQSGYIVLDSDLLWDEIYNTPEDGYRRYRETLDDSLRRDIRRGTPCRFMRLRYARPV